MLHASAALIHIFCRSFRLPTSRNEHFSYTQPSRQTTHRNGADVVSQRKPDRRHREHGFSTSHWHKPVSLTSCPTNIKYMRCLYLQFLPTTAVAGMSTAAQRFEWRTSCAWKASALRFMYGLPRWSIRILHIAKGARE